MEVLAFGLITLAAFVGVVFLALAFVDFLLHCRYREEDRRAVLKLREAHDARLEYEMRAALRREGYRWPESP